MQLERIYKLQKRCARLVQGAGKREPTLPLLKKLNWLTVNNKIEYNKGTLVYKSLHGLAPTYISEYFTATSDVHRHGTRSSSNGGLTISTLSTTDIAKTFRHSGGVLWNSMPVHIRKSPSLF